MMSRPNRMVYTPITRGHKPTASQESNTLSTMSEVSCTTTLSSTTDGETDRTEDRLEDFKEEQEHSMGWRSGSEETIDTVVAAVTNRPSNGGDDRRYGVVGLFSSSSSSSLLQDYWQRKQ